MTPRFLGLRLAMRQQFVDLVDQRIDLAREILGNAGLGARPDRDDFAAHPAKRPKAVKRLQRGKDQQAETEHREAANQRCPKLADLPVDRIARLGDLEPPAHLAAGQDHVALEDAQRLALEFEAVALVELDVLVIAVRRQSAVPQRTRREGLLPLARNLEISARIGLEEALVGGRAGEAHFAVGPDLRGGDHRVQDIFELLVEIVDDRAAQHPVERIAADQQQHADPQRRNADHAPSERPAAVFPDLHRRRRLLQGGGIVQAPGSSRL